jgi:putative restriction endonuclease
MGLGVFVHRADSIYEDSPAEQYQFPSQYLSRVEACVGNWIVYYEPTKISGTKGYFAVAKVQRVIPDAGTPGMYLALIEPGSYLDFANPVPFKDATGLIERGVLNEEGKISGRAQSAVRRLSIDDFERIVALGLEDRAPLLPRVEEAGSSSGFAEEQVPFVFEVERDRAQFSVSRIIRDRIFRSVVLRAYDQRCAITGLRLINGLGRAEVAAAHIRPVEAGGPDIVNNGIALSGTAHWMFDRGLIGLSDDLEVLVSRQANDQDSIRSLINPSGRALEPVRSLDRPHPHFLKWHRENCFKQ